MNSKRRTAHKRNLAGLLRFFVFVGNTSAYALATVLTLFYEGGVTQVLAPQLSYLGIAASMEGSPVEPVIGHLSGKVLNALGHQWVKPNKGTKSLTWIKCQRRLWDASARAF